jgi:hypothetical protein
MAQNFKQRNELTLLDQFAIAALAAVIAAATQTKRRGGDAHKWDSDALFYGDCPTEVASMYAQVAYGITYSMQVVSHVIKEKLEGAPGEPMGGEMPA